MSEPNGYLIHGTAFSSKEAAFKALVSNHEQESWFHKIWDKDAQPYYFESKPQLTISKSIADELKDAIGATNFESTPYSVNLDEDGYLKMWASLRHKKLSDKTYKFCRDNTRVFDAYLNPLTRDLVKVVEND